MNTILEGHARFTEDFRHIIDSNGKTVSIYDPRVVFVWPIVTNPYTRRLLEFTFRKEGIHFRTSGEINLEILQYAKKLCSGRECLPCNAIAGAALRDFDTRRSDNEISVYITLDQEGPCQNGAWPLIWDTFAKRLDAKNTIFGTSLIPENNFYGQGLIFGTRFMVAIILGDLLEEAVNSLKCLAADKKTALALFERETDRLLDHISKKNWSLKPALKKWVSAISKIKLSRPVEAAPRVLIFGGLNVLFINEPIRDYFIGQEIIPKVVDFTEGISWIMSEPVMRYGFKHSLFTPLKQYNLIRLLFAHSFFNKEAYETVKSRLMLFYIDYQKKRIREIMEHSGLMIDKDASFVEIVEKGHAHVSFNGYSETPVTTGRYVCSVESGVFDGLVNLGSFNCQPAMNAQGIIRPLANKSHLPYAAIDCEGPWISANQKRLLETVAIQAKRIRQKKSGSPR